MMAEEDRQIIEVHRIEREAAEATQRRISRNIGAQLHTQIRLATPVGGPIGANLDLGLREPRDNFQLINRWGEWRPSDRSDIRRYVDPTAPGSCWTLPMVVRQQSLWTMVTVLHGATYGANRWCAARDCACVLHLEATP